MFLTIVSPIVAALAYGGWAAFCNWQFDMAVALKAAAVQGGFAFSSTWLLIHTVKWLIRRQGETPRKRLVFLQCSFLLLAIPATLHVIVGTPNILSAMAPGLVIGNTYLVYLIRLLTRQSSVQLEKDS